MGGLPHTQVPKSHSLSNVLGDMTLVGEPFKGHNPLPNLMKELAASSNYEERKRNIEEFNKANKWKKKGISMVPIKYDVHKMPPLPFYCHIRQVLQSITKINGVICKVKISLSFLMGEKKHKFLWFFKMNFFLQKTKTNK